MILVVDYGSQYTQLIARRLRERAIYSEVYAWDSPRITELITTNRVQGIILSGGPASVYDEGAPQLPEAIDKEKLKSQNLPILGICYGLQLLVHSLGGKVAPATHREYGPAQLSPCMMGEIGVEAHRLLGEASRSVWMSHGDRVEVLPEGFMAIGETDNAPLAAIAHVEHRLYGLQFHPEVTHSERGVELIERFALELCGAHATWTPEGIIAEMTQRIREQVGEGRAIVGVSGGVDSSVAAALVHHAIGDRLEAVFVDNGLLRHGERESVEQAFLGELKARLTVVDASDAFLTDLAGVTDPEQKRKLIGARFIRTFEAAAEGLGQPPFLVQGTIYPDVIESSGGSKSARKIKAHHNVGGLPDDVEFEIVEPLRMLFKDEVRAVGEALGLPKELVWRQPFPGPGLAVRCLGEVNESRLSVLRKADFIFTELLREAGLLEQTTRSGKHGISTTQGSAQAFAVLLPVRSVGVMGDGRTYEEVIALRAVQTTDFMTAQWAELPYELLAEASRRIVNEVSGVNRVVYDITTKPPGTIEWE